MDKKKGFINRGFGIVVTAGEIRKEIQDTLGNPISGYDRDDCGTIFGLSSSSSPIGKRYKSLKRKVKANEAL
ncbi:MAG TPA: hypothetical protein PKW76_10870 [bacterium]|nr:hypothetical protein [bacterium]HPG46174.1 hypothetical protein [bacterium]HPM98197.1 hypothetical protein [bacterium]